MWITPWAHEAPRSFSELQRAITETKNLPAKFRPGVVPVDRTTLVRAAASALEYRPPGSIPQARYYRVLVGPRELSITVGPDGPQFLVWAIGNV